MMNSNKKTVKIAIVDFWKNVPTATLERYLSPFRHWYNVEIDEKNPDILLYSCFGEKHLNYDCKRVFVCGENVVPDFNTCDYSICTVNIKYEGKNLWIPESYFTHREHKVQLDSSPDEMLNRKFCSFIYSQDNVGYGAKLRKEFCLKLMQYKHIDCPGKILHNYEAPELSARNNVSWHLSKIAFLKNYKFNIAFENSEAPGYITEKLADCYISKTVPIYWGSRGNIEPYTKESMIYANDYASIDDLIEKVKEVDSNEELYLNILRANPLYKENANFPNFHIQMQDFAKKIVVENDILSHRYELTDSYRYAKFLKHRFWNSIRSLFKSN